MLSKFTQHLYHLQKGFDVIRAVNLKIKLTKCYFASSSVGFLSHHVSGLGIEPNKGNIDLVPSFPEPPSVKQVRAFLGFCVLYRRFIKDYAFIVRPQESGICIDRE